MGLSKSAFPSTQFLVSEWLAGVPCCSLVAGWWLIVLMQERFLTSVHPPWRFFANNADGRGDLSDSLCAATLLLCKFDLDALTISSVFDMYPMIVSWLF
jgi:hypothetical protein